MASTIAANSSLCPKCGEGLRCGMVGRDGPPLASTAPQGGSALHEVKSVGAQTPTGDAKCWCFSMPRVVPVPQADTAQKASCLCPACLQQLIQLNAASHDLRPATD